MSDYHGDPPVNPPEPPSGPEVPCRECGRPVEDTCNNDLCDECRDDEAMRLRNLDALEMLAEDVMDGERRRQQQRAAEFNADEMYGGENEQI